MGEAMTTTSGRCVVIKATVRGGNQALADELSKELGALRGRISAGQGFTFCWEVETAPPLDI